jgi:hypothetical protein
MDTITLGTGILRWSRHERITDRYGTVNLDHAPDGADFDPTRFDTAPIGTRGRLVAVILCTRRSPHCGDWARGFAPTTPAVGEEITLGVGTLIVTDSDHGRTEIGLTPDDGRTHDWLAPEALYRCHSQTVRLELRPDRQR